MRNYKSDTQLPIELERVKKIKIELATLLLEHVNKAQSAMKRVHVARVSGYKGDLYDAADDAALSVSVIFNICETIDGMQDMSKKARVLVEATQGLGDATQECNDEDCGC